MRRRGNQLQQQPSRWCASRRRLLTRHSRLTNTTTSNSTRRHRAAVHGSAAEQWNEWCRWWCRRHQTSTDSLIKHDVTHSDTQAGSQLQQHRHKSTQRPTPELETPAVFTTLLGWTCPNEQWGKCERATGWPKKVSNAELSYSRFELY